MTTQKWLFVAVVLALFLDIRSDEKIRLAVVEAPRLDLSMSKWMNEKPKTKLIPKKGTLQFEIPYGGMDCRKQSYELRVNGDTLFIVQNDDMSTCMKHTSGYFLKGNIYNLKKGRYYLNVVESIGDGIRYSLIDKPFVVEITHE